MKIIFIQRFIRTIPSEKQLASAISQLEDQIKNKKVKFLVV
jgi:hypothetical protein